MMPTNERTLVVLLPSVRFLPFPTVTAGLDFPENDWHSLATRDFVIKS